MADYWPEFAAAGKQAMPVSYLISHQAGLAWIDGTMTLDEALAWDPVVEALAAETPKWEPGTAHGYHATTYGWLVGEVVRRSTARSLGTFFHDEVATPLGLDFWIGLPEDRSSPGSRRSITVEVPTDGPARELMDQFMGPDTKLGKALSAPGRRVQPTSVPDSVVQLPGRARRRDPRGQRRHRRPLAGPHVRRAGQRGRRRAPAHPRPGQGRPPPSARRVPTSC